MTRLPLLVAVALSLTFGASMALAEDADPDQVARVGSVAPAFGLYPFTKNKGDELREAVQLEDFCGLRPGETKAVLVVFVDEAGIEDLSVLSSWWRKFHRQGLEVVAVSMVSSPLSFRDDIVRAGLKFPVLDDRYQIVAQRYGVPAAPFSFLLNEECRVLGFSNRRVSEDGVALSASIEAQITGQLGSRGAQFDD